MGKLYEPSEGLVNRCKIAERVAVAGATPEVQDSGGRESKSDARGALLRWRTAGRGIECLKGGRHKESICISFSSSFELGSGALGVLVLRRDQPRRPACEGALDL